MHVLASPMVADVGSIVTLAGDALIGLTVVAVLFVFGLLAGLGWRYRIGPFRSSSEGGGMLREALAAYGDRDELGSMICLTGFVQCPGEEVWPRFYDWLTRTYRCSFQDWGEEFLPLPPDYENAWEQERERGALRLIPEYGGIGRSAVYPGIVVRLWDPSVIEIDVYFKQLLPDMGSTRAAEGFLQATANELRCPIILTEDGAHNIWDPLTLDLDDEPVLARIDPSAPPPRPDQD